MMTTLINQILALAGVTDCVVANGKVPGQIGLFVDGITPDKRTLLQDTLNRLNLSPWPIAVMSMMEMPAGQIPKQIIV